MTSLAEIKRNMAIPSVALMCQDLPISISGRLASQYGGDLVIPTIINVTLPPIEDDFIPTIEDVD